MYNTESNPWIHDSLHCVNVSRNLMSWLQGKRVSNFHITIKFPINVIFAAGLPTIMHPLHLHKFSLKKKKKKLWQAEQDLTFHIHVIVLFV